jgi:hypothetical protein
MIRRIRPIHVLEGAFDTLNGEPYILDCRNVDIESTVCMMVRNAPEGMVGVSMRLEIGHHAIRAVEREARHRGARVFWLPMGKAVTGRRSFYAELFQFGWFASHSGFQLPWKMDCDAFSDDDWAALARLVAWKFAFRSVHGIPRGGCRFAQALERHAEPDSGYPTLIVDDVLTTGRSFIEAKARLGDPPGTIGVVVCARGRSPNWVWSILSVNEWAQSRATGLG